MKLFKNSHTTPDANGKRDREITLKNYNKLQIANLLFL